jgi:phosphate transport system permease protein
MNTIAETPNLQARLTWRQVKDRIMTAAMVVAVLVVALPLVLIIANVIARGIKVVDWKFLTSDLQISARRQGGGMGPAIVGTLLTTGVATIIAVPLGVMGAIYLHEYGGQKLWARTLRVLVNVMSGVPSIVMGLFIFTIWVIRVKERTAFAGGLALACLMLPIVMRSAEEMLRLVPVHLREASYALGSTKSRAITSIVLPAAAPGLVSGALLGIARALGETAPLLFAVGLTYRLNLDPFRGENTALPAQIYANAASPFEPARNRAYGAALTLVVLAFAIMLVARLTTSRWAKQR